METFVRERPLGGELVGLGGHGDASSTGPVTVDDAAIFSARFEQGPIGVFEATRAALGRRNAMRIEVNGSSGSLAFDFEDMNFLQFYNAQDSDGTAGFHRIMVTEPEHPYMKHWWPTGHGLGYEHLFTHEVADLVTAIGAGTQPSPSFGEALQVRSTHSTLSSRVPARTASGQLHRAAPVSRLRPPDRDRRAADDRNTSPGPHRPRRLGRPPTRRDDQPLR